VTLQTPAREDAARGPQRPQGSMRAPCVLRGAHPRPRAPAAVLTASVARRAGWCQPPPAREGWGWVPASPPCQASRAAPVGTRAASPHDAALLTPPREPSVPASPTPTSDDRVRAIERPHAGTEASGGRGAGLAGWARETQGARREPTAGCGPRAASSRAGVCIRTGERRATRERAQRAQRPRSPRPPGQPPPCPPRSRGDRRDRPSGRKR
jgi:hypothetical protein